LVRDGYLRQERVRELVDQHLARRRDHGNRIWLLLSAEVWYRRYIGGRSVADLTQELTASSTSPSPVLAPTGS
jgi:hypothetical protein